MNSAAQVEGTTADGASDTMRLWRRVEHTDPSATKKIDKGAGALSGMTAINVLAPVKMATELFGPLGSGWDFEIVDERYDEGAPIFAADGATVLCMEKHHVIRMKIWADWQGKRLRAEQWGSTPYVYSSKYGPKSDGEAVKKTTSDALKKCLTLWGFNSDIHMGMFDDVEYVREREQDEAISKADDKEAEKARQRAEYDEFKARHLPLMQSATQLSELDPLYVEGVRKAARQNDTQHVRTMNVVWKERAMAFMREAATVDKLGVVYKAAAARAREWSDTAWKDELNELAATRKAALTPEEDQAA